MPYCPGCRSEYRPGFARCADCDLPLVLVLEEERRAVPDVRLRMILVTESFARAFAFRAFLEDNGIPTLVENEHSWNHVLGVPVPAIPLVVSVLESDREDADSALREWSAPGQVLEPWKAPPVPSWRWPAISALMLLSLDPETWVYCPDQGILAWLAWIAIHAAVLARLAHPSRALMATAIAYGGGLAVVLTGGAWLAFGKEPFSDLPLRHMVITGPLEEFGKILGPLALWAAVPQARRRPDWRISLAAGSAFGFATLENLGYLWVMDREPPIALFATRSGSLLHLAWSLFVAAGPTTQIPLRLSVAAFLHGAWNELAEAELVWISLSVFAISAALLVRSIRRAEALETASQDLTRPAS